MEEIKLFGDEYKPTTWPRKITENGESCGSCHTQFNYIDQSAIVWSNMTWYCSERCARSEFL